MQSFFPSLNTLEQYTSSLNSLAHTTTCTHCLKSDQWVSHGYVYQQHSRRQATIVGKRILCSRRYGKSGCGRSRQLYLQHVLPRRRYSMSTLITFVVLLAKGMSVVQAYRKATARQHCEARHAWRWLRALYAQLGPWRSLLRRRPSATPNNTRRRSRRLTILLPTLLRLWPTPAHALGHQGQHQRDVLPQCHYQHARALTITH